MEAGTVPHDDGVVEFYKEFEKDKKIGGLCGFLGYYINSLEERFNAKKKLLKEGLIQ